MGPPWIHRMFLFSSSCSYFNFSKKISENLQTEAFFERRNRCMATARISLKNAWWLINSPSPFLLTFPFSRGASMHGRASQMLGIPCRVFARDHLLFDTLRQLALVAAPPTFCKYIEILALTSITSKPGWIFAILKVKLSHTDVPQVRAVGGKAQCDVSSQFSLTFPFCPVVCQPYLVCHSPHISCRLC